MNATAIAKEIRQLDSRIYNGWYNLDRVIDTEELEEETRRDIADWEGERTNLIGKLRELRREDLIPTPKQYER